MTAPNEPGCVCPRCSNHIPEQFYCRGCGYVPDWRTATEANSQSRSKAA